MQAIEGLAAGRSVLVAAPTGTGKTVVAEYAVRRALENGRRTFYTTPIKALSNQKYRDFKAAFGEERVGLMTGDIVENPDAPVIVMTTEILRNRLISDPTGLGRGGTGLGDVESVVFDEVHYLADPERGTAWEEAILLAPKWIQFVCLSATVSNADQIADWLRATNRLVDLIFHEERAVPLEHTYYLDGEIHPILDTEGKRLKSFRGVGGELLPGNRFGRNRRDQARPEPRPWEVVQALQRAKLLPGIYFVFSRRLVEMAAADCARLRLLGPRQVTAIRARLDERLAELSPEDRAMGQVQNLLRLLPRGIGFHHAGMIPILKILVEEMFADGLLKVVFATDTLSLGINMPAKSVVIGELTKYDGESRRLLLPNEYRQLTGRAGRRGIDGRGIAVVPYSPWVPFDRVVEIAAGDLRPLESAFRPSYNTALNLWRTDEDEALLARLVAESLRQFQQDEQLADLRVAREEVERDLTELPRGCPVKGEPLDYLQREREQERQIERLERQASSARRRVEELESQLSGWPWPLTRALVRGEIRGYRGGEMVYSRGRGWLVYVGASVDGIGDFLHNGKIETLYSYGDINFLPEGRPRVNLVDPLGLRADPERYWPSIARQIAKLDLPDPEALAEDIREANQEALLPQVEAARAARERTLADLRQAREELRNSPCKACPERNAHRGWNRRRRELEGDRLAIEQAISEAEAERLRHARDTVRSLRRVLERFGYLARGRRTGKAELLASIFDTNALTITEVLTTGLLDDCAPEELAEILSWFTFDRDNVVRIQPLTARLKRIRRDALSIQADVLKAEQQRNLDLSKPIALDFGGAVLAWYQGVNLGELAARTRLAEGDLVMVIQKTIDLCRQVRQALRRRDATDPLIPRLAEAEQGLRRGVIESCYRWALGLMDAEAESAEPEEMPAEELVG